MKINTKKSMGRNNLSFCESRVKVVAVRQPMSRKTKEGKSFNCNEKRKI